MGRHFWKYWTDWKTQWISDKYYRLLPSGNVFTGVLSFCSQSGVSGRHTLLGRHHPPWADTIPPGQTPPLWPTPPIQTPPGQTPSPWQVHPLGRHPQSPLPQQMVRILLHPLGRHPPGRHPPQLTPPSGRSPWADTPHSPPLPPAEGNCNGMHSCF